MPNLLQLQLDRRAETPLAEQIRNGIRNAIRPAAAPHVASTPIAAANFSANKIAVLTKRPAQRRDLNLQIVLADHDAWPDAVQELAFGNQRPVGFEQD